MVRKRTNRMVRTELCVFTDIREKIKFAFISVTLQIYIAQIPCTSYDVKTIHNVCGEW